MANRQARRYLATNSDAWRRIRTRILCAEPLCRDCAGRGICTPATDVDHIDGRAAIAWDYRDANLQPLCRSCHSTKTAIQVGSFGRKAKGKRSGSGKAGIPIDPEHPWNDAAKAS